MTSDRPKQAQLCAGPSARSVSLAETGTQRAELYPDYLLPIVSDGYLDGGDADEFDVLREQLVLAHCFQTARAYWRDLEDWRDWYSEHGDVTDVLRPDAGEIEQFLADRLRAGYSANTVARRLTTLRAFYDLIQPANNPARLVPPVRRTTSHP